MTNAGECWSCWSLADAGMLFLDDQVADTLLAQSTTGLICMIALLVQCCRGRTALRASQHTSPYLLPWASRGCNPELMVYAS